MVTSFFDLVLLLAFVYGLVSIVPFILATIAILKSGKSTKYKVTWLFICLLLGVFGVVLYYLLEKRKTKLL